jgi:hypothetical protein
MLEKLELERHGRQSAGPVPAAPPRELEEGADVLDQRFVTRLATLVRDDLDEVFRSLHDRVLEAREALGSLDGREHGPRPLRFPGARDAAQDLVSARDRQLCQELTGGG